MTRDNEVQGWASPIGQCNVWYKIYPAEQGRFLVSALVVKLGKSFAHLFDAQPSPADVEEHFKSDSEFRKFTKPFE